MVLPFEFIINRAGIEDVPVRDPLDVPEQKQKLTLERKLLEVRNFTPDVSHILMEPVPLTANLSFLDTSGQERGSEGSPLREAQDVREIQIADDDESMIDDDDIDDDDDDAFP